MIAISIKGHLKGKNYILFVNDSKMDVHSTCFLDFYAYCINWTYIWYNFGKLCNILHSLFNSFYWVPTVYIAPGVGDIGVNQVQPLHQVAYI